jgi:hypothetical protein
MAVRLQTLYRRAHLIAIALSTSCGLLICVVIALLFIGHALNLGFEKADCFIVCTGDVCLDRQLYMSIAGILCCHPNAVDVAFDH